MARAGGTVKSQLICRRANDNDLRDFGRYPVTDGVYDPDEYYGRGGASTKAAMDRWNIDRYDVYRSNIE